MFREEIQPQDLNIYYINKVIIQTNIYIFDNWINKLVSVSVIIDIQIFLLFKNFIKACFLLHFFSVKNIPSPSLLNSGILTARHKKTNKKKTRRN